MFGELIGNIFSSLMPVEAKLFLFEVTSHQVEAHVKCFGEFLAHVAGEYSVRGCIVSLDWSGWLRMDHFNQGRAYGNRLLAVEEDLTGSSLSGGCRDGADGLALC